MQFDPVPDPVPSVWRVLMIPRTVRKRFANPVERPKRLAALKESLATQPNRSGNAHNSPPRPAQIPRSWVAQYNNRQDITHQMVVMAERSEKRWSNLRAASSCLPLVPRWQVFLPPEEVQGDAAKIPRLGKRRRQVSQPGRLLLVRPGHQCCLGRPHSPTGKLHR